MRTLAWALAVALAVVAAGCGDSAPTDAAGVPVDAAEDLLPRTTFAQDTAKAESPDAQDTAAAAPDVPASGPETVIDTSGGTASVCEFAEKPETGAPGAKCTTGSDCDSGWCVAGPDGKICTKNCSGCCPSGYACEAAGQGSGDTSYICQPKLNALCRPCQADGECSTLSAGALCVGYGDAGRFCGGACEKDSDCFAGHACEQVEGTAGSGKQCIRKVGECSCSAKSASDGAKTVCMSSNAAGSCKGTRKCSNVGLTACDAKTPELETCNGQDDDCDGLTDEAGATGCKTLFTDTDGDGAGQADDPGVCLCKAEGKSTATAAGDCDDKNPAVNPGAKEVCNGIDDDCDGQTDPGSPDLDGDGTPDCIDKDIDGDGTPNETDCAPANVNISPAATETCNGADDNCNGAIDEPGAAGCMDYFGDADKDGFGKPLALGGGKVCQCGPTLAASSLNDLDCDDSNPEIHTGATETCDGKDNDCSGKTDEGCDDDADGYCDNKMTVVGNPPVCTLGSKDCDDLNAAISPGKKETCGNDVDDDCDGTTDIGTGGANCVQFFKDADLDGFGAGVAQCLCSATGQFTATNNKDCDDSNSLISPAKLEVCNNGIDDDCNNQQDEEDSVGCTVYFTDPDGDGYGLSDHLCLCNKQGLYQVDKGGDCKPNDPEINPGAEEICNGKDDNCKNGADESGAKGCVTYYADKDGDGIGDTNLLKCLCSPENEYTATSPGDCDDTKAQVKPGADEVCDGVDNDCNGKTDEQGAGGCKTWYVDLDNDGYGSPASSACLCAQVAPFNTLKGGDCNDDNNAVHPQTVEFCDGIDNNCNGSIDEENSIGCSKYMMDQDKDNYGVSGVTKCLCKEAFPFTASQGGDCDDQTEAVNPKAAELCDTIDNNCDGLTDPAGSDGCSAYYLDKDQDGYGTVLAAPKCLCDAKSPYTTAVAGDCNDNDKTIFPGAAEFCDNKDTNCDGTVDPAGAGGCINYYIDMDSDGYGGNLLSQCLCNATAPFTTSKNGDCNDQNGAVNPGALEVCNGVDDNCNGLTDDGSSGMKQYWIDADGDGYGSGNPISSCSLQSPYTATKGGDCNDNDKAVNPGAAEIPCNGKDDNCDGVSAGGQKSYSENFNAGTGLFTTGALNGVNFWKVSSVTGGSTPVTFPSPAYGTPNMGNMGWEASYIQSPPFDMTGGGTIKFDTWQSNETGNYDREYVEISYNGGASFSTVIDYTNAMWTPQKLWQTVTITVPANLGTAATVIRFHYDTIDGCCGPTDATGWYIDNFLANSTCIL